jgi:hypothetical protein
MSLKDQNCEENFLKELQVLVILTLVMELLQFSILMAIHKIYLIIQEDFVILDNQDYKCFLLQGFYLSSFMLGLMVIRCMGQSFW